MEATNPVAGLVARETLQGEKIDWVFRWILYGVFFVLSLLVWLIQSSQAGFWGVIGCGACLVYNCALTPFLSKNQVPRWIRYFSVTADTGCLTL